MTLLSPAERHRLGDEARRVLERNRRRGTSSWERRAYDFICPSPSHYPFQWLGTPASTPSPSVTSTRCWPNRSFGWTTLVPDLLEAC